MKRRDFLYLLGSLPLAAANTNFAWANSAANYSKIVYPGKTGKLIYVADKDGNTIPDFSNCGYAGGGVKLPSAPIKKVINPNQEDATKIIQAAIDEISALPPDKNNLRGTVLIKRGVYKISEPLVIKTSGVILRGEGSDENGTILVATQRKKHALITIQGKDYGSMGGQSRKILDAYVPVGARSFKLNSSKDLRVGDRIIVRRIGNKEWISAIKMDQITVRPKIGGTVQWQPFNLDFDRVITGIADNRITIDAPIVCAIDERWGGGEIFAFDTRARIGQIGIENMRGDSEFNRNITALNDNKETYFSDDQHGWDFVSIDNAENVWVKNITAIHFGHSAVNIGKAKWVTVEDSKCLEMVSEITGGSRYCFNIEGQQNLVQRCEAQTGRHDFVVGGRVCGPNVFLDGKASNSFNTSEPHHRWSVGGLFDNIKAPIAIQDRQWMGTGHGWSGANYVAWNCEGTLVCQKPPTAQNWAIGFIGKKESGAFAPREDGYWESLGQHIEPRSLYLQQLKDRLGAKAVKNIGF